MGQTRKSALIIALIVAIVVVFQYGTSKLTRELRDRASRVLAHAATLQIVVAEDKFRKIHGTYSGDANEIGYLPRKDSEKLLSVYIENKQINPWIRENIPRTEKPWASKDHFKFLVAFDCEYAVKKCVAEFDETGAFREIAKVDAAKLRQGSPCRDHLSQDACEDRWLGE